MLFVRQLAVVQMAPASRPSGRDQLFVQQVYVGKLLPIIKVTLVVPAASLVIDPSCFQSSVEGAVFGFADVFAGELRAIIRLNGLYLIGISPIFPRYVP